MTLGDSIRPVHGLQFGYGYDWGFNYGYGYGFSKSLFEDVLEPVTT